jgi:two-component system, OmpR family, response regulator
MDDVSAGRLLSRDVSPGMGTRTLSSRIGKVTAQSTGILVVESDAGTRRSVVDLLQRHGLHSSAAETAQGIERQLACDPTLIILDLDLGEEDGFELLRTIRSRSDVPIIVTSAVWREEADRILGFELGADDFITKPYGLRELAVRVRAALRRRRSESTARPWKGYKFNGWQLELRTRRLTDPNGAHVRLTNGEYALLIALLDAPQRPLTREYLLQATHMHADILDRSINVQIVRLRRKLETDPIAPRFIKTFRGVGYMFALPVEQL